MPCWYIQALNLPGSPDLSTATSQVSSSLLVAWSAKVSFRVPSKTFPRLFTGFSKMDGIWTPPSEKRNLSVTFPFFTTRERDLAGLKPIRAQLMSLSRPWRIHLQPGTDVVVTVRSSIKALMGG